MSRREDILAALQSRLNGVGAATAYRSREAAVARAEGVVILLRPEAEDVESLGVLPSVSSRSLVVVVTVIARGDIPDHIADPIITAAHAALMADTTLGGLTAQVCEESTKWDFEQADQTAVAVEIRYRIRYHTAAASLSAS